MLDADSRDARQLLRELRRQVSGCRSWATTSGSTANSRSSARSPVKDAASPAFSRSPIWCETTRASRVARQNVLFELRAQARTGRRAAAGSGTLRHVAAGAADRPRRPPHTRTTESSTRMWIGRSCSEERVGDRRPAARRVLVVGRRSARRRRCRWSSPAARRPSASRRWCSGVYGSITPSSRTPGATAAATRAGPPRQEHDRPLRASPAAPPVRVELDQRSPPPPDRRPSGRTACPRGAFAPAARATARSSVGARRPGGSRRAL